MEQNLEPIVEQESVEQESSMTEPSMEQSEVPEVTEVDAPVEVSESGVVAGEAPVVFSDQEHQCANCGATGEPTKANIQGIELCPSCWEKRFHIGRVGIAERLLSIYRGEFDKAKFSENYLLAASRAWRTYRDTFVIPEAELLVIEKEATEMGILIPEPEEEQE